MYAKKAQSDADAATASRGRVLVIVRLTLELSGHINREAIDWSA
jgi:hypothetical protein